MNKWKNLQCLNFWHIHFQSIKISTKCQILLEVWWLNHVAIISLTSKAISRRGVIFFFEVCINTHIPILSPYKVSSSQVSISSGSIYVQASSKNSQQRTDPTLSLHCFYPLERVLIHSSGMTHLKGSDSVMSHAYPLKALDGLQMRWNENDWNVRVSDLSFLPIAICPQIIRFKSHFCK